MIHPFLSWLFIQRKQKWTGDVCTSMFTAALFTITKTWTLHKHTYSLILYSVLKLCRYIAGKTRVETNFYVIISFEEGFS